MDIDQLRYFLGVLQHGGFTAAANELLVSQSTLSRSIQRLENELGQPLLERKSRSIEPTVAGSLLAARAEQILSLIRDAKAEITDDGQTGEVRLGSIPTVAPYFLPGFLRTFAADFPDASIVIQEDTTDRLIHRCEQGELDALVLALPIASRSLEATVLFDEPLFLLLPASHPAAAKQRVSLGDVASDPFILMDEVHCLTDTVVSFCRSKNYQPLSVEKTSQLMTVQELVALGHGVSIVPEMARRSDDSSRRLYRPIAGSQPSRTIAVAWNGDRFQSRIAKSLRDRLSDYVRDSPGG